jgi:hypothetical protein
MKKRRDLEGFLKLLKLLKLLNTLPAKYPRANEYID